MFDQRSRNLPKYIIETPTTLLCKVKGLFSSSDLQVTITRVSISVLKEGRCKVVFLLIGPIYFLAVLVAVAV